MKLLQALRNLKFSDVLIYSEEYSYPDHAPIIIENYDLAEQAKALLTLFYCARYFELTSLNKMIVELKLDHIANELRQVVILAKANLADGFDVDYLYEHFFDFAVLSVEISEQILIFWLKLAYGRSDNLERNFIVQEAWVDTYFKLYLKNIAMLGMVKAVPPLRSDYHETWVLGANEKLLDLRLSTLKQSELKGVDNGEITILAGQRELCAGLDNQAYIFELAQKLDVEYDKANPWIKADDDQLYLNYLNGSKKLYETDLARDKAKKYYPEQKIKIIDSARYQNWRPTTSSTAEDAFMQLINKIESGAYRSNIINIRIQSNQPFAQRQILPFIKLNLKHRHKLRSLGYEVNFEVTAAALTADTINCYGNSLAYIHSELAGLVITINKIS